MKFYLAGPMTGLPEWNFPAFNAEAARLRALGHEVVNPAEHGADPALTWADYMRLDIAQLVTCDSLVVLPGWERSRGAKLEHYIATALDMPCGLASRVQTGPLVFSTHVVSDGASA